LFVGLDDTVRDSRNLVMLAVSSFTRE
jgi:hypothetical protein